MKLRMIAGALLMVIGSAAVSTNAGAAPWRGHRGGVFFPRPAVRFCPPAVLAPRVVIEPPVAPIIAPPVVVGGGYYDGGYYGPAYRGYARGYDRGYYGHGYARGYDRGHYAHGYRGRR